MIGLFKTKAMRNELLLYIYEAIFRRPIINLYARRFSRRVLISYSTYHFSKDNYAAHSNYNESHVIASIFDNMGYQVDVVNNNRIAKIDFSQYDVVFGEGLPVFQAIQGAGSPLTIYYGTGSHPFHCTQQSYNRLIYFCQKYRSLPIYSTRTSDYRWGLAASLADTVICIGNSETRQTFIDNGSKRVYSVDPTFHQRPDRFTITEGKDFSRSRKSMLWFGSYGLLHKGLDLAVEAFRDRSDWTLHICGYTEAEKNFLNSLDLPCNVVVHGFVNVLTEEFADIASEVCFVILPSCSEGTATAVVTAVGNGGMVPIVTKECGYDVGDSGFVIELSVDDIGRTMDKLDGIDISRLKDLSLKAQSVACNRYTVENFKCNMSKHLTEILGR